MSTFSNLLLLLGLIVLSGLFSGTETALFSLTKIEKRRLRVRHASLAVWVNRHLEHPRDTLMSILLGNLLVNTLATAFVTLMALEAWGPRGAGLALGFFTLFLIFVGEIIPKTLAVKHNEVVSLAIAVPLRFFSILIYPLRWVAGGVSNTLLSWLIPERREKSDHISEGELKALLTIGEEEGVLDREERQMIHKVFELGERPVNDIMTPRVDVIALDKEDSHEEHIEDIKKHHYAYFPVYEERIDNLLGIVPAQEYLLNPDDDLEEVMIQPLLVPETKRIDEVLAEFKQKNKEFAVCLDEYGGMAGVVTLEDILEEIFGEFYDEYEKVENPIRPFRQGAFLVEAKISLADFNEHFDSELESEEATTLGGYILEKVGEVPKRGFVLESGLFKFTIQEVIRHRRIRYVIVERGQE